MGTVSPVSQTDMKFLSFLLCVSLTAASIVRREAEPAGYGAEPQCTVTPVKECKPRIVETPKEVCQTVVDKHEDTVVTETCEEEITTTCVQVSSTKKHSSKVVDKSTALVETGVPRQIETKSVQHSGDHQVVSSGYSKREAEPTFPLKFKLPNIFSGKKTRPATSSRRHTRPHTSSHSAPSYHSAPVTTHHAPAPVVYSKPAPVVHTVSAPVVHHVPVSVVHTEPAPVVHSAPAQTSPPVKTCSHTPVSKPRHVSRVVCETVVDITHVEDCTETITKSCASSSTSHSSNSRVVGHDVQVIAGGSVSGGSGYL